MIFVVGPIFVLLVVVVRRRRRKAREGAATEALTTVIGAVTYQGPRWRPRAYRGRWWV